LHDLLFCSYKPHQILFCKLQFATKHHFKLILLRSDLFISDSIILFHQQLNFPIFGHLLHLILHPLEHPLQLHPRLLQHLLILPYRRHIDHPVSSPPHERINLPLESFPIFELVYLVDSDPEVHCLREDKFAFDDGQILDQKFELGIFAIKILNSWALRIQLKRH
jgi:hypothetical protein